eukprot:TRINITY_DN21112_c0_g1_i1.p1 TRINITY_DN21112_c0_g1~~TRINITY_DN21112_c0_g1_i1.p1  ORF type:complete len:384 (-),score=73.13 TRINITY_DN21112_c0_g1_i1:64-1215(-)
MGNTTCCREQYEDFEVGDEAVHACVQGEDGKVNTSCERGDEPHESYHPSQDGKGCGYPSEDHCPLLEDNDKPQKHALPLVVAQEVVELSPPRAAPLVDTADVANTFAPSGETNVNSSLMALGEITPPEAPPFDPNLQDLVDDTVRKTAHASSCGPVHLFFRRRPSTVEEGISCDFSYEPEPATEPVQQDTVACDAFNSEGWWSKFDEDCSPPHKLSFSFSGLRMLRQWALEFPGRLNNWGALEGGAPLHVFLEVRLSSRSEWRRVDEQRMCWPWNGAGTKRFCLTQPVPALDVCIVLRDTMGSRGAALSNLKFLGCDKVPEEVVAEAEAQSLAEDLPPEAKDLALASPKQASRPAKRHPPCPSNRESTVQKTDSASKPKRKAT